MNIYGRARARLALKAKQHSISSGDEELVAMDAILAQLEVDVDDPEARTPKVGQTLKDLKEEIDQKNLDDDRSAACTCCGFRRSQRWHFSET